MNSKLLIFVFLLLPSFAFSQQVELSPFNYKGSQASLSDEQLNSSVEDAVVLSLDESQMSRIMSERPSRLNINVPIDNNRSAKLILERFEIFSQDAKIIERKNSEEINRQNLRDLIVSYKGVYAGDAGSMVSINFTKTGVRGLMLTKNETYVIGALENSSSEDYILYEQSKLKVQNDFMCGTDALDLPSDIEETVSKVSTEQTDHGFATLLIAEVAVEIDFATYNTYGGSMENTLSYALSLMATSSALYMKDVNVRIIVPYTRVWTTPDPYTSTTSSGLLNQFRDVWNSTQTGVERTIAHFISRRAGNLGGIAWLNVLCANTFSGFGYGFSNTTGAISQLPLYSWDAMVVSHEMGHNFGSPHTFSCSWPGGPIDTCYQPEGGCYSGPTFARVGTIMSYCHLNGSIALNFGLLPGNLIRERAEGAFCMYTSSETLVLGYPNGGEIFNTNTVAKIYWGTSLTGNVNLQYSLNDGSTWQTIENNVPAQNRQYDWTVPYVEGTLQAKIRILDSSNPSVGDTSNTAFRIKFGFNLFSTVYPPINSLIVTIPNSQDTSRFVWTKAASLPVTYKYKIRKITPGSPEYIFSSDNSGTDTVLTLTRGTLDSLAGLMGGTTSDTVSCIWRVYAYSGPDSGLSANALIVKLARTTVGINPISSVIPDKFYLDNNYPNPFNPTTKIRFDISKFEKINISVFDMLGRKVNVLVNEQVQPGRYEVEFNASGFASGIYYYRMETSEYVQTRKMLLIK